MQENYMLQAIKEAKKGELIDEVPVGAVIVCEGKIIAKAHNLKEKKSCSNYHAEMVAIAKACKKLGQWRLYGCEMYVTMEPCPMCAGAIINARMDKVIFGAYDKKAGCCGSVFNLVECGKFNHITKVEGGVMEDECAELLSNYFKKKRKKKC